MQNVKSLSLELQKFESEIHQYAVDYGLDFYPVIFEMCDYDTVNILAAQAGFPTRYPHWKFGMDYEQLSKSYAYGLQKIYEMVINTNPCYAYLLMANNIVDQKTVMAHVYGHADFFKNNAWFANTDRKMMDVMANHGTKIRRYMEKYGEDKVEAFIDLSLSLENLLDVNQIFQKNNSNNLSNLSNRSQQSESGDTKENDFDPMNGASKALRSFVSSKLNDTSEDTNKAEDFDYLGRDLVNEGDVSNRDIMKFLMINAPVEEWQADILAIIREEAYYFLPQRMTKIMNEGWASYWHAKIMTQKAADASEIIDFASHHAGIMAMSKTQINPYKIGIELYRDIEHRWNTGKFGKEYNECNDMATRENWNKPIMLGRQKIFEVRKTHNDLTFIDEFFTADFCERQQLFTTKTNSYTNKQEIDSRDFEKIKANLLSSLTNFGQPLIELASANVENRGELLLKHVHYGTDLDVSYAADTMRNIQKIWKRPVSLLTEKEGQNIVYKFDGVNFSSK